LRAEVLGLAQCHSRHYAKRKRFLGNGDHVLFPMADHDWISIQVRAPSQLEMVG